MTDEPDDDGKVMTVDEIHQAVRRPRAKGGQLIGAYAPSARQREAVAIMVANHVPTGIIAMGLDMKPETLAKYFKKEIKYGKEHIIAKVGTAVLRKALAGNISAARYWLMTHGGPEWKLSRKDAETEAAMFGGFDGSEHKKRVTFYLPKNGRDQPEPEEPGPLIDGEATGTDDAMVFVRAVKDPSK